MKRKDLEDRRAALAEELAEIDRQLAVDPDRVDPALLWPEAVVEVLDENGRWGLDRFVRFELGGWYVCERNNYLECRLPADIIQWREHDGRATVTGCEWILCEEELANGRTKLAIHHNTNDYNFPGVKRFAVLRP